MGIDQVAVVGHCIGPVAMAHHQRLGIGHDAAAGGRITHMPDGRGTVEAFQGIHIEYVGNQSHAFVFINHAIFGDGNTGAFLPPMLQGVKSEIAEFGGIRMIENPEKPAGLTGFVVADHFPRNCCRCFHVLFALND